MRKSVAIFFLFTFCAASSFSQKSGLRYEPIEELQNDKLSARSTPAGISKESEEILGRKDYVKIGKITNDVVTATYRGKDLYLDNPVPKVKKNLTEELCIKAAARGGDLVVLIEDNNPYSVNTVKSGKVIAHQNHRKLVNGKWVHYTIASDWEKIDEKIVGVRSIGIVWRHDPDKRLAITIAERKAEAAREAERRKAEVIKNRERKKAYDMALDFPKADYGLTAQKMTGGNYGIKDDSSKVVIEPQFIDLCSAERPFSEDLAGVAVLKDAEKKWGYIDKNGKWIIQPAFDGVHPFSEGLAAVSTGGKENRKWGFIDKAGKLVIPQSFRQVRGFSDGLAAVRIETNKFGYIDRQGQFVIKPQFTSPLMYPFYEGLAQVFIDGKYGYLDKTGALAIKPQFDLAEPFSDGMAVIKKGNGYGYIDKKGNIAIKPQFYAAYPFINGIARANFEFAGEYIYMDKSGEQLKFE